MVTSHSNRKISIAHLLSPIVFYGKEKWLLSFLRYCDRDRFEYIVIPLINETNTSFCDYISSVGIECIPVRMENRFSLRGYQKILSTVRAREVDIVHSHDYKSDFITLLLKCGSEARVISTPHGWSNEPDIKLLLFQGMGKLCLSFFDRVVPLSSHMTRSIRTVRKSRLQVIDNFIDIADLPERRESEPKLFTYIGRLTKLKRIGDALEALKYTSDRSLELQVIGEGPHRAMLEHRAKELGVDKRVHFLGFRKDRLELLGKSAALVLPSLTEGISRAAMEAMALGKPVIGTDIPGISVLIQDGVNGMLVPVKDPRSIASAMDTCVARPAYMAEMGKLARATIIERFSAPVAVEKYERLYDGLISRR